MKVNILIPYILLGTIVMLIGALVSQWQNYQSKVAYWKQYARGCSVVADRQDEIIRNLIR